MNYSNLYWIIASIFCSGAVPTLYADDVIEPLTYFSYLEIASSNRDLGPKRFGLSEIRPTNISALLRKHPEMGEVVALNRFETAMLITHAKDEYRNALEGHRGSPLSLDEVAFLEKRLSVLDSGRYPIYMITDEHDSYIVYLTMAIGWDYGGGMPSEIFCKTNNICDLGLKPVAPRTEPNGVTIRFIPRLGGMAVDEEASAVLSSLPVNVGARTEVMLFGTPIVGRYDLVAAIHRRVIANQDTLHSRIANSPSIPYSPEQQERLAALPENLNSDIELSTSQDWLINDQIYIWMTGEALRRYYRIHWGFDDANPKFKMPNGDAGYVAEIGRVNWETKTMDLLGQRSRLVSTPTIVPRARGARVSILDEGVILGRVVLGVAHNRVMPFPAGNAHPSELLARGIHCAMRMGRSDLDD